VSTCRSCGAPIVWARTVRGKMIPLNSAPDPAGNMVLVGPGQAEQVTGERLPLEDRYMPHHATCPQGRDWRRAT
jgi:hypothetical protein